jgi:hypothetical protein
MEGEELLKELAKLVGRALARRWLDKTGQIPPPEGHAEEIRSAKAKRSLRKRSGSDDPAGKSNEVS